jgi:hypothetical protein
MQIASIPRLSVCDAGSIEVKANVSCASYAPARGNMVSVWPLKSKKRSRFRERFLVGWVVAYRPPGPTPTVVVIIRALTRRIISAIIAARFSAMR